MKNRNNKKKNQPTKSLEKKIIKIFTTKTNAAHTYKSLWQKLGKEKYRREDVFRATNKLWNRGIVDKVKGRFVLNQSKVQSVNASQKQRKRRIIEGIVDMTNSGAAFVISEETDKDTFIPANRLNRAMDGDRVKINVWKGKRRGKRLEGEVIEIVKRSQEQFVGILKRSSNFAFLIADDPNMKVDLFIPTDKTLDANDGDKVMVKIVEWPADKKSPVAEVVHILGKPGTNDVEMLSILINSGFRIKFPKNVLNSSKRIPSEIKESEISKRRDFRPIPTFTIDPADAKDFDDALSLQRLDNGHWEVGIHIADVTHYVRKNTLLDKEAYERSTSVYLVDRVLPMFPERLSNVICSLRPHEDKLCFSAVFELDDEANIHNQWFGRTVIYSDRRFSYSEAQAVLDTGEGDMVAELLTLNKLAKKLRARRMKEGSINFNSVDVRFKLDENGKPIGVYLKKMLDANLLIEDFMLLANRKVAAFLNKKMYKGEPVPTVNRIHDAPDLEKLTDFSRFASSFGYRLNLNSPQEITKSLNELLRKVKGKPEQTLLETLAIRSMAKAAYSTKKEVGHYGLAFADYTHFTSPIRRYPDVMVHRLLAKALAKQPRFTMEQEEMDAKCEHTSAMERKAMTAERASIKYKQVEYMSDKIGEEFDGVISGVKHFGFFVELEENKCEGLVRIESLNDDFYNFYEQQHAIQGSNKGKNYQLGSKVRIVVVRTDLSARTIDFEVAGM